MIRKRYFVLWDRIRLADICLVFAALLLIELFCMALSGWYIHLLSQAPAVKTGVLESVWGDGRRGHAGLVVRVDGEEYSLYRSLYSRKTYGLLTDLKRNDLMMVLAGRTGSSARVEYIEFSEKSRTLLRFWVDGVDFLDPEAALKDHLADERQVLIISSAAFVLTLVIFVPAIRYKRKQEA